MTRSLLLCTSGCALVLSAQAAAQVSVPLPGRPAGTPSPLPVPSMAPAAPAPTSQEPPPAGQTAVDQVPIGKYGRPDINPYDRDIDLTVPLTFRSRPLGDIAVRLTFDDQFFVESASFLRLIGPLLNDEAGQAIAARLKDRRTFTNADIAELGISLEYDPSSLAVVVLRIDPRQRALEHLFDPPSRDNETPDLQPAGFSAYLNLNVIQSYYWQGNNTAPTIGLNGAMRLGRVVFEADAQVGNSQGLGSSGGSYRFDRSYARLVYDEPEEYRRWYAGDLTPEIRGQQSYVQMAGIGVVRQRQRFDQYRSSVLLGNRQLVLQRDSDVRILRNGVLYRQMRLESGAYDFSSLPLMSGSNDVQIEVRDSSGAVQTLSYQSYLDPIDLVPGDYEYAAYFGPTSERFGQSPTYDGPVAFTGFFRKAFLNAPAIGIGVQVSRDIQVITGQTQYVLGNGGRVLLDGGASNDRHHGQGFAVGASYDQIFDRGGLIDSFSLRADYLSERFSGIGNPEADNPTSVSVNAQYTRAFTRKLSLLITGTYTKNRHDMGDSYRIGGSANYYLSRQWSLRGGVDYTRYPRGFSRGTGLGFNIALVWQPDYRQRAEARHDSSTDTSTLSYTRASTNQIGTFGFGGIVGRDFGSVNAQGFVDYTGNRFDASLSHTSYGQSFSRFGDTNVTTMRIGTSLAFADGAFGIGRRINDSFAILYPHDNLRGHSVVAGQSLAENEYLSKSGTFGGAVNGFLTSYVSQSVQYDVENPPTGYDVGSGVVRVKPPYRSGYKLRIGTDAFVSATGTLVGADGAPVSLAGGHVTALDGKHEEPLQFFTNSVGRFAISNLRPGVRYRVELFGSPGAFTFDVPADTTGLVDLRLISLTASPEVKP